MLLIIDDIDHDAYKNDYTTNAKCMSRDTLHGPCQSRKMLTRSPDNWAAHMKQNVFWFTAYTKTT